MPTGQAKQPHTFSCQFCGKEATTLSTNGRTKYCSRTCSDNGRKRLRAYNVEGRLGELANSAKYRATPKGVPYNIDKEHLLELWKENDGKCCITGVPFDLSYSEKLQKGWSKKDAPSLDRIVPELGYVKGNVRLVAFQVNCAMGLYSDEDFYEMCRKALENRSFR